jgi:hypothetical protein
MGVEISVCLTRFQRTCSGKSLPSGYSCIEAEEEQTYWFDDHKTPLYLVYHAPEDACPNLFAFTLRTVIASSVRAQFSYDNFLYVLAHLVNLSQATASSLLPGRLMCCRTTTNPDRLWDTQTESGSTWSSFSFDCNAPRTIYIRLTFDWGANSKHRGP